MVQSDKWDWRDVTFGKGSLISLQPNRSRWGRVMTVHTLRKCCPSTPELTICARTEEKLTLHMVRHSMVDRHDLSSFPEPRVQDPKLGKMKKPVADRTVVAS